MVLAVLAVVAVGTWALRHPAWGVRTITVQGDVVHQNAVTFRAQLASQMKNSLSGSFLTLDLQQVRSLFEAVPLGAPCGGAARVSQPAARDH